MNEIATEIRRIKLAFPMGDARVERLEKLAQDVEHREILIEALDRSETKLRKELERLTEANDNLFKISRKYCIENKRLRLFLDGEVALVEELGKYVKTQCCEGSKQQHEGNKPNH